MSRPLNNIRRPYTYYLDDKPTTLADISNFTELQSLNIKNIEFSDISVLKELKMLKGVFILGYNDVSPHLDTIAQLSSLEWFALKDCGGIKDFSFLRRLINLRMLMLLNVGLTDLEIIGEELENLSDLYVCNNSITDLESLQNLQNLETLDVSYNPITDLEPLQNISTLRSLIMSMDPADNFEIDVTPLNVSDKIYLTHHGVPIANLHGLNTLHHYKNTERVYINGIDLNGIEVLSSFENIKEISFFLDTVDIFGNDMHLENADFGGFKNLDNIESITFHESYMMDTIDSAEEDEYFELFDIKIKGVDTKGAKYFSQWDLSPLAKMKNLKTIGFDNLPYSDIPTDDTTKINIDNILILPNLETLILRGKVKLPPVDKLEQLKELDLILLGGSLSNDEIIAISKLPNLEYLRLPHGDGVDISLLGTLKNLKHLSIVSKGSLTFDDMKTIVGLKKLEYLRLSQKERIDFSEISTLKSLKSLSVNSDAPLTNDDVKIIAGMKDLEYLRMGYYIAGDTDISPLFALPNLDEKSKEALGWMRIWKEENEDL